MPSTKRRLAAIASADSDLLSCMKMLDPRLTIVHPKDALALADHPADAYAILGGTEPYPLLLPPPVRTFIEREIAAGKRVFAEFAGSIGNVYFEAPSSTRYVRLAVASEGWLDGEPRGGLIDDQCGERLRPHAFTCSKKAPLLSYVNVQAHDRTPPNEEWNAEAADRERALWFEQNDCLLVCAFRLAMFSRARHAPHDRVRKLVRYILGWLYGQEIPDFEFPRHYRLAAAIAPPSGGQRLSGPEPAAGEIRTGAERALGWAERAGILQNEGKDGALEGLGTEIDYSGRQRVSRIRRADCIGELALAYWLHSRVSGDSRSDRISGRLAGYVLDHFVCREPGPLFGMMRWTDEAWGVCYQDDAARALLPHLFRCLYEGTTERLKECEDVLLFLIRTTGTDGTRPSRTDNHLLTEEALERLRTTPGNLPSAHYNAYYYAALSVAYRLTGREQFRETAIKGLSSIMAVYPATRREQSQTQELCRLILPLSWLYAVTGSEEHREWLYRVAGDLQAFAHDSGAYVEWDEGYLAAMRHRAGEGESSLLARNGDPVADLLYSNNWLPLAWIQAYFVTGDRWFRQKWLETVRFFLGAQIVSPDSQIDGAWARALDVERMEVFGSPADSGWGPWAIESGWTVAEIAAGMLMGLLEDELLPLHAAVGHHQTKG
nr:hypothetical protein [Cohnella thermotolerans]